MTTSETAPPAFDFFGQILPYDPLDPVFRADPYPTQVAVGELIQLDLELAEADPPHMQNLVLRDVTELLLRIRTPDA